MIRYARLTSSRTCKHTHNISILDFVGDKGDGGLEVVITVGAIRRAKLQTNRHHQQTNSQLFTGLMPFLSYKQQCQSSEGKHIGDRNCTTLQLFSAACLISVISAVSASTCSFLLVSDCAVPLQCLWHESVTLISTLLIIIKWYTLTHSQIFSHN